MELKIMFKRKQVLEIQSCRTKNAYITLLQAVPNSEITVPI
jgi:hypothetical protein